VASLRGAPLRRVRPGRADLRRLRHARRARRCRVAADLLLPDLPGL